MKWADIFTYRDGQIYWRSVPRTSPYKPGDLAGYDGARYRRVKVQGTTYSVHRIIWEMHHGPLADGYEIDHIDGNTFNNCLGNLRSVTHTINMRNTKKSTANTSGTTGVYWHTKHNKWTAQLAGKYLGVFDTQEEAKHARMMAQQGQGYTDRHGQRLENEL